TAFSTTRTGIGLGLVTTPIAMVRLWPILPLGVMWPQASVRYQTYGVATPTNRRTAPLAQGSSWPSVRYRFTTRTITAAMSPTRYAAPSGRTRYARAKTRPDSVTSVLGPATSPSRATSTPETIRNV